MKLAKWALLKKCVAIGCLLCSSACGENKPTLHKPLVPIMAKAVLIASATGLKGVEFGKGAILDNDEIWLLGYDGRQESLYYSKDGGTTWQKKPFTDIYSPSDIAFTKNKTWLVDSVGYMYYSIDCRDKWVEVATPNKHQFEYIDFYQDIGYAIVEKTRQDRNTYEVKPGIQILRTRDGGAGWQICYEDKITLGVLDFALWQKNIAVLILDDNSVEDSTILWTDDQGKHWKRLFKPDPLIDKVVFNNAGLLWGVANKHGLYYSRDKGQSWHQVENFPTAVRDKRWRAIAFNKKDYGVCSASDGTLVITKNGGKTWEELKTTIPRRDSGDVMRVMMGEKFMVLDKNGEVYRIPLPKE